MKKDQLLAENMVRESICDARLDKCLSYKSEQKAIAEQRQER